MARFRIRLAIWLGKLAIQGSRLLGRGGSNFPGRLSLILAPQILSELSKRLPQGIVLVTATNGKTTTTRLLAGLIREAGMTPVTNSSGANMLGGLVTALVEASSFGGSYPDGALGVFEVDEGSLPGILPRLRVSLLILGNFFPDQVDRYGDSRNLVRRLAEALERVENPPDLIANADDPLVAWLADRESFRAAWCGLGEDALKLKSSSAKPEFCPRCQTGLTYRFRTLAQLGDYHCQGCGFRRPNPEWRLELEPQDPSSRTRVGRFKGPGLSQPLEFVFGGVHFLYNSLLALTAVGKLGLLTPSSLEYLRNFRLPAGREEEFDLPDRKIALFLVKNPVGADLAFDQIAQRWPMKACLLVFNNLAADGRDLGWLYQAAFESLVDGREFFTAGGSANRLALRLTHAGASSVKSVSKPDRALELALARIPPGEPLVVIVSYTALGPFKRLLAARMEKQ